MARDRPSRKAFNWLRGNEGQGQEIGKLPVVQRYGDRGLREDRDSRDER